MPIFVRRPEVSSLPTDEQEKKLFNLLLDERTIAGNEFLFVRFALGVPLRDEHQPDIRENVWTRNETARQKNKVIFFNEIRSNKYPGITKEMLTKLLLVTSHIFLSNNFDHDYTFLPAHLQVRVNFFIILQKYSLNEIVDKASSLGCLNTVNHNVNAHEARMRLIIAAEEAGLLAYLFKLVSEDNRPSASMKSYDTLNRWVIKQNLKEPQSQVRIKNAIAKIIDSAMNRLRFNDLCLALRRDYDDILGETLPLKIRYLLHSLDESELQQLLSICVDKYGIVNLATYRTRQSVNSALSKQSVLEVGEEESTTKLTPKQQEILKILVDKKVLTKETRTIQEIWTEAIKRKKILYKEAKHIVETEVLTLPALRLWGHLYLKSLGYIGQTNNYENIDNGSGTHPFDTYLRVLIGHAKRRNAIDKLQDAFNKMLPIYRGIVTNTHGEKSGVTYKSYTCAYCGTLQRVAFENAQTPHFESCKGCANTAKFIEITGSQKAKPIIKPEDENNLNQIIKLTNWNDNYQALQGVKEIVRLAQMDFSDIRLWFDRVCLQLMPGSVAKIPSELISNSTSYDFLREFLLFCGRSDVPFKKALDLLKPKPQNQHFEAIKAGMQVRTCYCAECKDVWQQPIAQVGLVQLTDKPLYSPQGFEIKQIACGACRSTKVFYNADFSINATLDLEQVKNDERVMQEYLQRHFSIEEVKRLIAYIMGTDELHEDLESNQIGSLTRELFLYLRRRNKLNTLLQEIIAFRFESQMGGTVIALTCDYCGRITKTRINSEGYIMAGPCQSCSSTNSWKVYQTPDSLDFTKYHKDKKGNQYVPYDMYDAYVKDNGMGAVPSMIHQTALNGEPGFLKRMFG